MNRETESAFVTYERERACSKIWVGDTLLAVPHTSPEFGRISVGDAVRAE